MKRFTLIIFSLFFLTTGYPVDIPHWAQQQIEEDITPHIGKSITANMIKALFDKDPVVMERTEMVHVQFRNGTVRFFYSFDPNFITMQFAVLRTIKSSLKSYLQNTILEI